MGVPKTHEGFEGKRRWVGFQCIEGSTEESLKRDLSSLGAKLIQFQNDKTHSFGCANFSNYEELLKNINGLGPQNTDLERENTIGERTNRIGKRPKTIKKK